MVGAARVVGRCVVAWGIVLALGVVSNCGGSAVGAQDVQERNAQDSQERPELDDDELELAFRVAKVAANEGALWNLRDTALIWQTVEHRGRDTAARLKWLAKHSPKVHGMRACLRGNCLWSQHLKRNATLPAGLAAGLEYWEWKLAPKWSDVLLYAEQLVAGDVVDRPCLSPPDTWGGPGDVENAIAHGLIPLGCEGTLNEGWVRVDYSGLPGGYTP